MINTKEKKKVGRMSRFLRFCAFLSVLFFTSNLMAAGYTCSVTPTYLGCKKGYYLSDCGSDETKWTGQSISSPSAGNSCVACPDGYDCKGTILCPVTDTVKCSEGTYLDGSTNNCTACPAGSYCKGGEFTLGTTAGISECPLGYRNGTTTGSKAESDCVMKVAAGKYVKTAKESSASGTCASGTYKVEHTVKYGVTSTCSTCPDGYSGSATGAESMYYCYATCQPGTAVFTPGAACGTQEGAWYTEAEHTVYWNRTSPITYCPYGSVEDVKADADHSNSDVCTVSVTAGHYSLLADDSNVGRIRISSTVEFPLVEVQAFYQNEQVSVAYASDQSSGVSYGSYAVNGNLTYNQSAIVSVGGYAVFGVVSGEIDEIRFALGNIGTVSITVEVDKGDGVWKKVFSGIVKPGIANAVDTNATLQSVMVTDRLTGVCEAGMYSSLESDEVPAMLGNVACLAVSAGYWNNGCGTSATGAVCSEDYKGGKVNAGYYSTGGGTSKTPTAAGNGCLSGKECGIIAPGYYGSVGATTKNGSGKVDAGYFSTGGAVTRTPAAADCVEGNTCGNIAPGYWGVAGATTAQGSGAVNAGYYSTYGGTSATPSGFNSGCVGYNGSENPSCGLVGAGYYSTGGGTSASGTCADGFECGQIGAGVFSLAGGTKKNPTWFDMIDFCVDAPQAGSTAGSCGVMAPGYYSTGGGTSASGTCLSGNSCGAIDAGYYSAGAAKVKAPKSSYDCGDSGLSYGCGPVSAGYWNNGCGTSATGAVCSTNYSGGMVNKGHWNSGCGTSATGAVCGADYSGGMVNAGYYNLGGGTSATPEVRGKGCVNVSTTQCGTVAPGYWGAAGATQYGGSGAVRPGYYSTGGATSATPTASDCAGKVAIIENGILMGASEVDNTCGQVLAGYWNNACGINATGGVCSTSYQGGIIAAGYWGTVGATDSVGSGRIAPGYYSTGGATIEYPDPNQCVGNNTCGAIAAGYWNNGGGTMAAPTAPGNGCHSDKSCGQVNAGYYSTGGGTSATPTAASNGCLANKFCGKVAAGYYATGGATSAQGHGIIKLGLYSTCGATSVGDSGGVLADKDYLDCVSGCECGRVAAGYYSTGGGTSKTPTANGNGCVGNGNTCGMVDPGYYSRGGAGKAKPDNIYCWGYDTYSDGVAGCGLVGAGYWNNGGGTDVNGTCVSGKSCGLISAGYYGNAGATTSTGAGEINGGFFSTGGGKTATPASNSDCAGDGTTCGKIAAGYWSYRGGKTATPTSSADCTMGYCGVIRGGYYSTCGGIEEYATEGSVNSCADGCECGPINPGYYSTGCSVSDDGAVCDTSKYTVGEIVAGYYSDGGSNTPQGDGLLAAGYFSTGGATVRKPTSADCVGSNTCGTVNAGYYVSGGGTLAAPVAFGNGCVGQWKNNAGEMVNHACGKVGAGYWNNGGGTDVNGTCVSGKSCGLISAGYYGNAGATSSTGAGTVWPGHFSTGGATKQKPTAADCVGDNTCGLVAAGYWTSHGGKTATPTTAETDCVNKSCGKIAAGYFSTGGATRSNPTEVGNHCFGTSCGLLGAGYYSSGGGTSATPTAVGNGCLTGFVCGGCPTGYDDNTAQGKTAVGQCQISCAAGTRVAARNAACTSPAGGWFSAETLTSYGNVSPVSYCMDGYTSTSTSASGHDAVTDCVQTIDGGKYVPSSKINARYVKLTGNLENSANNYGVHVVEMQAFASNDGTGTNLMADSTSDKTTDDDWRTSSHVGISTAKTWDLGSVQSLGSLKFALYAGRTYYDVAIYVSEDNTNWTTVFGPQDVLTQSISPLVGEVVVLSAVPKSCAAGTYKASGSLALTNTSSCDAAQAGYFVGTTGASSQTKCVIGSYTDTTGQSACKACAGGKTNSADGSTSCTATCSNATGVASTGWETPVWGTDNKMTNLCTVTSAGCSAKYYKNDNACSMCPAGYQDGVAGYTQISQCTMNVAGGKYVAVAKESSASGTCEQGYAKAAHPVTYGATSSCDACTGATYADQEGMDKCEPCPTVSGASGYGYWNTSSEAGNHTVRAGCQASFKNASIADGNLTMYSCYVDASADTYGVKGDGKGCWVNKPNLTCNGGYYNKKFNDSTSATQDLTYKTSSDLLENVCRDVESGYWSGADSLTRTACATGLVTCGAGLCANEAGDCGRKLHAGDNVIYLRSEKRTGVSPLLHLKVGDKMFYGNMSTSLSGPLKVKYNNTKYSVVNDNQ